MVPYRSIPSFAWKTEFFEKRENSDLFEKPSSTVFGDHRNESFAGRLLLHPSGSIPKSFLQKFGRRHHGLQLVRSRRLASPPISRRLILRAHTPASKFAVFVFAQGASISERVKVPRADRRHLSSVQSKKATGRIHCTDKFFEQICPGEVLEAPRVEWHDMRISWKPISAFS